MRFNIPLFLCRCLIGAGILFGCATASWAQTDWAPSTPLSARRTFISTGLDEQPRPSFLTLTRYRSLSYALTSEGKLDEQAIEDNSGLELGLNFPLVLRPGFKVFGSLRYAEEDFELDAPRTGVWPSAMHNKSLRQYGASLLSTKVFRQSRWFLVNRLQASLAGDVRWDDPADFLQCSWATVVGWKKSERTVWGLGGVYSVDPDGSALLPVLLYQLAITPQWTLDALLPTRMNVQYYSPNQKSVLYGSVSLEGPDYRIGLPSSRDLSSEVTFERSDIQLSLRAERELYDWLWFGVEAGRRFPVSTDWVPHSREILTRDLSFESHWFTSVSLFLVPPRRMFERVVGR